MTGTLERPRQHAIAPARSARAEYFALAVLLLGTTGAYLWNLNVSGWANAFYSAAAQAGSQSWTAFFFGSSDAANSITVDKPPASLWLMSLSVRLFGLGSWSILVPQVLMGVASVALLWAGVRRYFGAAAGLLAGTLLALTPVAVLMFRFNNPDALLVLLMIGAAWTLLRAVENGRTRWLVATGVLVGFGFLTKQLQVMLVLPPLALTYLLAGPPRLLKRIWQLLAAGGAMAVAAGWWLLIVELWPARSRPWIGGSQNNSILELTLGYNGLGRLNGNEVGSVRPGGDEMPGRGSAWGEAGIGRMFDAAQAGQIAWLLPAAIILAVTGIVLRGRASRTDSQRAVLALWLGWLVVTALVFSYMQGIFHAYYTVALAPAVAVCAATGFVLAWRARQRLWVRGALALTIGVTAATAWTILRRSPELAPSLRWIVLGTGALGLVLILVEPWLRRMLKQPKLLTLLSVGALAAIAISALGGQVAYAVETLRTPHTGGIVSAGPRSASAFARPPGGMTERARPPAGQPGQFPRGALEGDAGGLLNAGKASARAVRLLSEDSDRFTWAAAAVGANNAAGYQLATGLPVMPIGGFNGSDPSPTLEQFQGYVAAGKVHYFIAGGGMFGREGGPSGGQRSSAKSTASQISEWVQQHYRQVQVDGATLYDLTAPLNR